MQSSKLQKHLESRVDQNDRPPYPKVAQNSLKVDWTENYNIYVYTVYHLLYIMYYVT